jgi:hypothetical protein
MSHEEFLTISRDDRNLYGILTLPVGPPRGGVVIVHGWSGCRMGPHRILVETARRLAGEGFAALRFDLSGRGESEGDPFATDLDVMFEDACAATDALAEALPSGIPLGLLGMCSGGNVCLGALTMRPGVRAAVCWSTYPFQSQRQRRQDVKRTGHFAVEYAKKIFRAKTWKKLLRGRIRWRMILDVLFGHFRKEDETGRNPQESRRDAEIVDRLGEYPGRLFFLFGGGDPEAVDARKIFQEFFSEHGVRAEFDEIPGANHNFYSLEWKEAAIERTATWFGSVLHTSSD